MSLYRWEMVENELPEAAVEDAAALIVEETGRSIELCERESAPCMAFIKIRNHISPAALHPFFTIL